MAPIEKELNVRSRPIADIRSERDITDVKWVAILSAVGLTACSGENHSIVVDVAEAGKPVSKAVVTLCEEPPKALERTGKWFVGRVIVGCEGSGNVRLTHNDGTTTDCPIGYVTSFDDWWMFEVQGSSCAVNWSGENHYS